MTWGQNEWLWLIGIVLAALVSWFFGRMYGNRRRKLLFTWDAVPLMPDTSRAKGALEVSYEGTPVAEPYIVQITVKNIGSVDIASSDFDADRDLTILLPKGYLTVVDTHVSLVGAQTLMGQSPGRIEIKPVLLRRGATISLDVLVDGNPEVELDSPLINTDIVNADSTARTLAVLDEAAEATLPVIAGPFTGVLLRIMNRSDGSRRS